MTLKEEKPKLPKQETVTEKINDLEQVQNFENEINRLEKKIENALGDCEKQLSRITKMEGVEKNEVKEAEMIVAQSKRALFLLRKRLQAINDAKEFKNIETEVENEDKKIENFSKNKSVPLEDVTKKEVLSKVGINFEDTEKEESELEIARTRAEEIGADGFEHGLTPFNGNGSRESVFKEDDTGLDEVIEPKVEIAPGIDPITAEEIGADGFEHGITPFGGKETSESVFKEDDSDVEGIIGELGSKMKEYKINVVSVDEIVRSYARRIAEDKVNELVRPDEEGGFFRRLYNKVRRIDKTAQSSWVRLAEDGYRYKYEKEIIERITENQNLMQEIESCWRMSRPLVSVEGDRDINNEILNQVIKEHASNVQEEIEMGEAFDNPLINARFQDLISEYCLADGMTREQFERRLRDVVADLKEKGEITDEHFLGKERVGKEKHEGFMYASNLFAVAEAYKNDVASKIAEIKKENLLNPEQEKAVAEHVRSTMKLDIKMGSKIADLHNKQPLNNFSNIECLISRMQRVPYLGRILTNPGTLAVLASAGTNLVSKQALNLALKVGIGAGATIGATAFVTAWAPILVAGLSAGTFAYFRRGKEVKQDAAMDKRQRALGQKFDGKSRRSNYERFGYNVRSTNELTAELKQIVGTGPYESLSEEEKSMLAEMFARFKVELDRDKEFRTEGKPNRTLDLISVEEEEGDKYGTNIISKTDLKSELWEYLRSNNLIDKVGREIAIDKKEFIDLVEEKCNFFNNDVAVADRKLSRYRISSSVVSGAFGFVAGAATAIGFQELWAGVKEHFTGKKSFTALDTLFHRDKIDQFFPQVNGVRLTPGLHDVPMKNAQGIEEVVQIFTDDNGVIDVKQSKFPDGWIFDAAANKITVPGFETATDITKDLAAIGKEIGVSSRAISYHGYFDHFTPPKTGVRAWVETLQNLVHNRGLNANKTELLLDFKPNQDGSVNLDLTKMVGQTLKGSGLHPAEITELIKRGGVKLNFAFHNEAGGMQNNPLSIDVADTVTKLPEKFAKLCTEIQNGKVITKGLLTLTVDDSNLSKAGSREVLSIASIFKGPIDPFIIKNKIPGVEHIIQAGEPIDIAQTAGAGFAPRLAPEGRTRKDNEGKHNNEDGGDDKQKIEVSKKGGDVPPDDDNETQKKGGGVPPSDAAGAVLVGGGGPKPPKKETIKIENNPDGPNGGQVREAVLVGGTEGGVDASQETTSRKPERQIAEIKKSVREKAKELIKELKPKEEKEFLKTARKIVDEYNKEEIKDFKRKKNERGEEVYDISKGDVYSAICYLGLLDDRIGVLKENNKVIRLTSDEDYELQRLELRREAILKIVKDIINAPEEPQNRRGPDAGSGASVLTNVETKKEAGKALEAEKQEESVSDVLNSLLKKYDLPGKVTIGEDLTKVVREFDKKEIKDWRKKKGTNEYDISEANMYSVLCYLALLKSGVAKIESASGMKRSKQKDTLNNRIEVVTKKIESVIRGYKKAKQTTSTNTGATVSGQQPTRSPQQRVNA